MAPPSLANTPMEIKDKIACYLETREDLLAFSLTCKGLHYVVISPKASCLREMFRRNWDLPPGKAHVAVVNFFKERHSVHWGRVDFNYGRNHRGRYMRESYAGLAKPTSRPTRTQSQVMKKLVWQAGSRNIEQLQQLVKSSNLMRCNNNWIEDPSPLAYPTKLWQAIWLSTLQWQLEKSARVKAYFPADDFLRSQRAIYEHPNLVSLFHNRRHFEVNLSLTIDIANFFKYYLAVCGGSRMYHQFQALKPSEKPQAWRKPILQGSQKLGKHWKGCHGYLPGSDVGYVRSYTGGFASPDILDEEHGFATLTLNFKHRCEWPKGYEDALTSIPTVSLMEKLKEFPENWIASQDDALQFSNNISDYGLKKRAETGDLEATRLLSWRQHSRVVQYSREAYPIAKVNFFRTRGKYPPSPPSSPEVSTLPATDAEERTFQGILQGAKEKESALPSPSKAKPGTDYHPFIGRGRDGPHIFNCVGNVHAVPPVEDIPGWQRVTMIKRYKDHTEWCYEGVVLPGNMIFIGRWWLKDDEPARNELGPFIYWNIDN